MWRSFSFSVDRRERSFAELGNFFIIYIKTMSCLPQKHKRYILNPIFFLIWQNILYLWHLQGTFSLRVLAHCQCVCIKSQPCIFSVQTLCVCAFHTHSGQCPEDISVVSPSFLISLSQALPSPWLSSAWIYFLLLSWQEPSFIRGVESLTRMGNGNNKRMQQ